MYKRHEINELSKRLAEPRKHIQVIMGSRQVGKTTMVNQLLQDTNIPNLYESADNVPVVSSTWLEQIWDNVRLRIKIEKLNDFILVVDEIQKIKNWSEVIKKLWDQDTFEKNNIKVVLLGSSRLLLQKGLTESLAGRFETIYLSHWSFTEMEDAFGWDANTYAWFGGYPGSADLIDDEKRWKHYIKDALIETSISKDILMLSRIDKPVLLKNLFELGCVYSGQILSYNKILGQIQDAGNTTTLAHYLNLLNASGLLAGIEKFSYTEIRKRASSPKFQVYNTALISSQMNYNLEEIIKIPSEWGRVIESVVGMHLINNAIKENYKLYYWRDRNDEVDFVLEKKGSIVAIEVKSSISKNLKGMSAFKKKFNPNKIYVIDNKSMPWNSFLRINPSELF